MNTFSERTIRQAFKTFEELPNKGWQLRNKNDLYRSADRAFSDGGDFEQFKKVYDELKRTWGLRRKGQLLTVGKAFQMFANLSDRLQEKFKAKRLRTFARNDITELTELLRTIAKIKKLKKGPSVMAMSKLLHFWNPRFFVIFDRAVMEDWVFKHRWLESRLETLMKLTRNAVSGYNFRKESANAFSKYIAVLWVCSECLNSNAAIGKYFFQYCCRQLEGKKHPRGLRNYDALAVESFLEGATHLPPHSP